MSAPGGYGDIATDFGLVGEIQVSAQNGDISRDAVIGIDADIAKEDGYVTFYITVDMDGAEGAGDVPCALTFVDGDVAAKGGAVLIGAGEGSGSYEKEGGGEEEFRHELPLGR